ncbi:hypothetical protein [uncultured Croceitalea sp.]|uniref:hypothetical protein n=1 Tax=uncultured Croceitalea sp. TaxID=1798908 RepID=UPI0033065B69
MLDLHKTKTFVVSFLMFLSMFSCVFLEGQDKPQVYPDFDYSLIEEVVFYNMETKRQKLINDFTTIENTRAYFLDKNNYFRNELRKFNGVKPDYSLTLISPLDTLVLRSYPNLDENKLEFDFTERYDPNNPMKSRKVYRFYINDNLMEILGINLE